MHRSLTRRLRPTPLAILGVLSAVTELAYLLMAFSGQSLHIENDANHLLLAMFALLVVAFVCYLIAIRASLAAQQDRRLLTVIAISAILFRVTLLFSNPIEEVDLYRYLWDGQATVAEVSPYRYSPQQVLRTNLDDAAADDLARLIQINESNPDMSVILDRIHFGELPTIYPPTSQAVFAIAALSTPPSASVVDRMIILKAWFVAFDLGTIALVVKLLRWVGKPVGWATAYAWCPLVIKEFAASGHLDALAVFLTTAAVYLACRAIFPLAGVATTKVRSRRLSIGIYFAALVLALAIGAKFYPIVLAPLFALTTWRRFGWQTAVGVTVLGGVSVAAILWPMVPRTALAELAPVQLTSAIDDAPPLPPPDLGTAPRDPTQSLRAFLSEWEMNDFLFLVVMENVRPTDQLPADEVAWFSIVPESWRREACRATASIFGVESGRAPFFLSRAITSAAFMALLCWFAIRAARSASANVFLEAAFLTVAWFWLLLPTQNPWYWTWALPLLPFARNKAWIVLSGLAMMYYLRFWLTAHFLTTPLLGTGYRGPQFFDYVVTWLEFGPWFVALALTSFRREVSENNEHY